VCNCATDFVDEKLSNAWLTTADAAAILLHIIETTRLPVRIFKLFGHGGVLQARRLGRSACDLNHSTSMWSQSIKELHIQYPLYSDETTTFIGGLIATAISLQKFYFHSHPYADGIANAICDSNVSLQLRQMTLISCFCSADALIRLLATLRHSLDTVLLDLIVLTDGTWRTVFEALKNEVPVLRSITVSELQEGPGDNQQRIYFCYLRGHSILPHPYSGRFELAERKVPQNKFRVTAVRYRGTCMNIALGILARRYYWMENVRAQSPGYPDGDRSRVAPQLKDFSRDYYELTRN
jgi:hypothetical protein